MSITCLFPGCEKQLQLHDLEDHIRHHFHLKLHRCCCGKRFNALADLQEHLETSADDEMHCSNDGPRDVYLKALVNRIVADCKSAENGASILLIASNLRLRAHAVASRSTSVTPARTVVEKRPVLELQKEVIPQKVHCSSQIEDSSDDLTILMPSRSATTSPIRPVKNSSERERNFSELSQRKDSQMTVSAEPLNASEQTNISSASQSSKQRDHTLATHEQSSASTAPSLPLKTPIKNVAKLKPITLHEPTTDVTSMLTLPMEKMSLPPELAHLGDVTCQKCSLSFTVEFNERRAHVANTHVSANQGDWRYTGDYRQELAYQMRECFPDLASEDDLCVVCYGSIVNPTRYASTAGRMNHIRSAHLPVDKFLPCPFAVELDACKMHRFKTTEEVNHHCQLVHDINGYSKLKETRKPLYERFLRDKDIYNSFCLRLKWLYFPVRLNSSAVTSSNRSTSSPLINETANGNGKVVTDTDTVQQEAQRTDDQSIKQEVS